VNGTDRTVTLPSDRSKTNDARTLGLGGDLLALIERRRALRRLDCPFVFHRDGKPLGDFRHAWQTARKRAGVAGRLFHDLRRTAVRNLIRANVPERIAIGVIGHKTRAVFDRYNIVDRRDTEAALARVEEYLATQATEAPSVRALHEVAEVHGRRDVSIAASNGGCAAAVGYGWSGRIFSTRPGDCASVTD
jgi:hypothetical protein